MSAQVADTIDIIAGDFSKIADLIWDQGRARRARGEITLAEYDESREQAITLLDEVTNLIKISSSARLAALTGDLAALNSMADTLKKAKKRIKTVQNTTSAAVSAIAAIALIGAAILTPTPSKIAAAVKGVADLAAAVGTATA